MIKLSQKQTDVLNFVKSFIADKGYPPTRRDIANHFGFKSQNAAQEHLQALIAKGCITINRGVSRGIKVISA